MRKLILLAIFIAASAPLTFAQNSDDYDKVNFFAGYSHNRVDTGISDADEDIDDIFDEREGFNGFNVSITGNVHRYVGITGDYSFHRKRFTDSFGGVTARADADLHNFLGGVTIKDNAKETKVRPFANFLIGGAHAKTDVDFTGLPAGTVIDDDDSESGFAAAIGGGVDIRLNDRVDFRAVKFEYNPTRLGGETQHNFRIGIGVVIK